MPRVEKHDVSKGTEEPESGAGLTNEVCRRVVSCEEQNGGYEEEPDQAGNEDDKTAGESCTFHTGIVP